MGRQAERGRLSHAALALSSPTRWLCNLEQNCLQGIFYSTLAWEVSNDRKSIDPAQEISLPLPADPSRTMRLGLELEPGP